ncbi:MAG: heme-binding protein, partial [Actinomycetota bacterium]|nr:heme-binding protein [Actinomycetota bacterium]
MAAGTVLDTITLEEARRVITAAERKAEEIGQPMDIAVVDAGGNLKSHVRMDGAHIGSITIAINKAYTAIAFQGETAGLQELTRPDGPIYG